MHRIPELTLLSLDIVDICDAMMIVCFLWSCDALNICQKYSYDQLTHSTKELFEHVLEFLFFVAPTSMQLLCFGVDTTPLQSSQYQHVHNFAMTSISSSLHRCFSAIL